MKNEIAFYSKLSRLRDILKRVQQLSWNINQFDKKYPLEKANTENYPSLLFAYTDFLEDLKGIADCFTPDLQLDEQVESEPKMKQNKNANKNNPN